MREPTRFQVGLFAVLFVGLLLRLSYLFFQPAVDPFFANPGFDGEYYLNWARELNGGGGAVEGAYYLAPLYPLSLALFVAIFGEYFGLLYLLQHLLGLATAALIALGLRDEIGDASALAAAALYVLYHPLLFFASAPLGETLGLFLFVAALAALGRPGIWASVAAGLLIGAACLVRPNLLLVACVWTAGEGLNRRWKRAALLVAGLLLVLLPVTLRNLHVSGHPALISNNGGLTLYHGNGPGAAGVYTSAAGFSGRVSTQSQEAVLLARARSGLDLDAVEADRWWGRQALRARLDDPRGTLWLLGRRFVLLFDNYEYGLDYPPMLDPNPARPFVRGSGFQLALVSFALLLGAAVAGVVLRGFRGTGGGRVWGAIAAGAMMPLVFYMSSRYRLPAAALMTIPAGCGLAALAGYSGAVAPRRRWSAIGFALVAALFSLVLPFQDLRRAGRALALSNRAVAYRQLGDLTRAEDDARSAVELAPRSATTAFNLGWILESRGRLDAAETAYRSALKLEPPGRAEAAENLASMLIGRGSPGEAVGFLRQTLELRPNHAGCWNNLVVALYASGDEDGARLAAARAAKLGVRLNPALLDEIRNNAVRGGADP
jgi:tetratricopeptide (TPR) repeat protein